MADPPLLGSAAGIVEAPVDATWEALLASIPQLAPHDARTLAQETSVQNLDVVLDQASGATMPVIIEPARRRLTMQGQWWYRDVTAVEADRRGSLVLHRIYNIAPLASRWLVPFVHRHDEQAFQRAHEQLVATIGRRLGRNAYLVDVTG